ncbi:hypothetical protein B4U80_06004, partial [Leptotrombidium deliense]
VFVVVGLEAVDIECKLAQVLILTPTREIALQVAQVVRAVGVDIIGLSCKTFVGGINIKNDKESLKKCHVAVGTPGRVKQLIEFGLLKTSSIRLLVLDEADKLMDNNFKDQIDAIYKLLPESKQVIVTSATYPNELSTFLSRYMKTPVFIKLNEGEQTLLGVTQYFSVTNGNPVNHVAFEQKVEPLLTILNHVPFSQCIIFSNYHSRAETLCERLNADGWPTAFISGDQQQKQRFETIAKVKNAAYRVLIATDLISRGIDCEYVNLVINLDVPDSAETYLHRVGRAGRFGQKGLAITLASEGNEKSLFDRIQQSLSLVINELPNLNVIDDLWSFLDPEKKETMKFDSERLRRWILYGIELNKDGEEVKRLSFSEIIEDYIRFTSLIKVEDIQLIPFRSLKVRKMCGLV